MLGLLEKKSWAIPFHQSSVRSWVKSLIHDQTLDGGKVAISSPTSVSLLLPNGRMINSHRNRATVRKMKKEKPEIQHHPWREFIGNRVAVKKILITRLPRNSLPQVLLHLVSSFLTAESFSVERTAVRKKKTKMLEDISYGILFHQQRSQL